MFRRESTTPYTSFASSSNESVDVGCGGSGAMGLWADMGVCASASSSSGFTATTMPEDAEILRFPYSESGCEAG